MEIKNSKLDWHKRTNPHTFFQYESRLNFDPNLLTSGSKIATLVVGSSRNWRFALDGQCVMMNLESGRKNTYRFTVQGDSNISIFWHKDDL